MNTMHSFFKSFVLESIFIGRLKKEEVIYIYTQRKKSIVNTSVLRKCTSHLLFT